MVVAVLSRRCVYTGGCGHGTLLTGLLVTVMIPFLSSFSHCCNGHMLGLCTHCLLEIHLTTTSLSRYFYHCFLVFVKGASTGALLYVPLPVFHACSHSLAFI